MQGEKLLVNGFVVNYFIHYKNNFEACEKGFNLVLQSLASLMQRSREAAMTRRIEGQSSSRLLRWIYSRASS